MRNWADSATLSLQVVGSGKIKTEYILNIYINTLTLVKIKDCSIRNTNLYYGIYYQLYCIDK